jgi:hypothetical protein
VSAAPSPAAVAGAPPVIVDGPACGVLPACPLPGHDRAARPLFVIERELHFRSRHGWARVPRGYVTDFASVPAWATLVTGLRLQPLGRWAWAAVLHDLLYAIGEPGRRAMADDVFRERLKLDGVDPTDRAVLFAAVRLGGGAGYACAPRWWASESFADPETGAYPVRPPFAREAAFVGGPYGLRPVPDWLARTDENIL